MNTSKQNYIKPSRSPWSLGVTFAICMLAGNPVYAGFPYPDSPLQTGSRVPANLMILLDDSGSMQWDFMPGANSSNEIPATTPVDIKLQTYTKNTLYYNPSVDYFPWRTDTGARRPVTPYTAVYSDNVQASGGPIDLSTNDRVFHMPKLGITNINDASQYYRYILKTDGTAERQILNGANVWVFDQVVTTFTWPGPITRTVAQERQNFATWFSYHRTRTKVAKAGISESFADLGEDIRVGFDTIWNRNPNLIPVGSDDGLFRGPNRTAWYASLQSAIANNGTPLRSALNRTGQYFSNSAASGPYGPQTGVNQLVCRQNFTILTTDGYWNSDGGFIQPDQDTSAGSLITNPQGGSYTYAPVRPFRDGPTNPVQSNVLADVAMRYWKDDLRTDMANIVPTTTADPAFWQHMVTFGISIGLKGTLDKTNMPGLLSGATEWTTAAADTATAVDDLFHAAVNGHGDFIVATDPQELAAALKGALSAIIGRVGSSSNVSANSVSVGSGTRVYQASYITGQWTGELAALPIVNNQVGTTPSWLATQNIPAYGARNILTRDTATGTGASFPTVAQEATLATGIANYIKGQRSNEIAVGGAYRDRINVLGDIVNSSPAYAKDNDTVFISANDGMLHAFDGLTGVEKFAYVPAIINLANLKTLVDSPYDHRYLVDGPVVVSDRSQTPNKNILIGSLGRGGKGIFSLNVTNPSAFATSNVLWEADGSDTHMGNVISRPIITKVNYNNEMAVIVSNGINSTSDSPALFVYGLESGTLLAKLAPIDTDGAGPINVIGNNGLSAATGIDVDTDGDVDYVYAGDMKGNVWKFDLSDASFTNWNVSNAGAPFFSAKDAGGIIAQPISGGIAIAFDDTETPWVFFGTGRYLTAGDPSSTSVQTWYGLRDDNAVITGRGQLKERKIIAHGQFAGKNVRAFEPKVYDATTNDMAGKKGWYIDLVNDPHTNAEKIGERIVGTPLVRSTTLLVSSIIPSLDPCASGGSGYVNVVDIFSGSSGVAGSEGQLDVNNNGVFNDDKLTDVNGNQVAIGSVDLGVFMPTDAIVLLGTSSLVVAAGSQGGVGYVPAKTDVIFGRISWRELINN